MIKKELPKRKILNDWNDYLPCNNEYCAKRNHSRCRFEFEEKLELSKLATQFFQLDTFDEKIKFYKARFELLNPCESFYYSELDKILGIETRNQHDSIKFNELVIAYIKWETLQKRDEFSDKFGFPIHTYEELKEKFKSILKKQISIAKQKEIKDLQIKWIKTTFKSYDKELKHQSDMFNSDKHTRKLIKFKTLWKNVRLGNEVKLGEEEIRYSSQANLYRRKLTVLEYIDFLIYLEEFSVEEFQENTQLKALMQALISNEFIDKKINYSDFKAVFLENKSPNKRIEWIDKGSKAGAIINKRTLFRFLSIIHPEFKMDETAYPKPTMLSNAKIRNKIINKSFKIGKWESLLDNTLNKSNGDWRERKVFDNPKDRERTIIELANNYKNSLIPSRK